MQKITIRLVALAVLAAVLVGCKENGYGGRQSQSGSAADTVAPQFTTEIILGMTPIKNQGASSLCWAYAMLATIETEHIMRGDSVNLSPAYVARMFLKEQVDKCYSRHGNGPMATRGVMPQLIRLIETYGLMPYDSYHSEANCNVVARKLQNAVRAEAARGSGIARARNAADKVLDETINPLPGRVYMFSMEYTPIEFAHSVCMPDEYVGFTSVLTEPFEKSVVLAVPDNYDNEQFVNLPIDKLIVMMERSVRNGHPVCWEGDTSENGFSFGRGVADVPAADRMATPQKRQRGIDSFKTTDDHCMAIVGIAHDEKGRKYFVCKNSWGKDNPYDGLMYMSFDYARLKTLAVMLNVMAIQAGR